MSLAPGTLSPHFVLLQAIGLLHARGWECARVLPYSGGPSAWRCEVHFTARREAFDIRPAVLLYTSAAENDFFQEGRAEEWQPSELADRLDNLARERRLAKDADPEYSEWYFGLLGECGPGSYPVAFEEWHSWQDEGVLGIHHYGSGPTKTTTYRLPPGWADSVRPSDETPP